MSEPTVGVATHLDGIAVLIAHAIGTLAGETSPRAVDCEIQARAALAALATLHMLRPAGSDRDCPASRRPAPGATARTEPREPGAAHGLRVGPDSGAGADLAAAEQDLAALPSRIRNDIAVCAAATYLRRARRALAES